MPKTKYEEIVIEAELSPGDIAIVKALEKVAGEVSRLNAHLEAITARVLKMDTRLMVIENVLDDCAFRTVVVKDGKITGQKIGGFNTAEYN